MHFTRHTDYALRLLLHLAANPDRQSVIGEVAEIHDISRNHLMKVVQQLSHGGFLSTRRGRGGGFMLARPAETIRIGEVVRFTEPGMTLAECTSCRIAPVCGLTGIFSEAKAALLAVLDRYSLADARGAPGALAALLTNLAASPNCAPPPAAAGKG